MSETETRTAAGGWNFEDFGGEFDEHVAAHLPGYTDVQHLVELIASFAIPAGGVFADLGASTGLTAARIAAALPNRPIRMHLYDSDRSMLEEAAKRVPDAVLHQSDLTRHELQHAEADLTVALWLLQFLSPIQRVPLLKRARLAASAEGAIIVAAKTFQPDARWETIAISALDDYKAEHGVNAEARAAKTRSLRGTQHLQTANQLCDELSEAGWSNPAVLWRWHVWTVVGAWAKTWE